MRLQDWVLGNAHNVGQQQRLHGLPDGHDDLGHRRDGRLVVLDLRRRLHGHAHGRGLHRRGLHGLPDGHDDLGRGLDGHHVVLVLRSGLHGHAHGRGLYRRWLHDLRGRILQGGCRLGVVRGLPDGHDDLGRGRDGRLIVLVLRRRLHGHAHGRGLHRRGLHSFVIFKLSNRILEFNRQGLQWRWRRLHTMQCWLYNCKFRY